MRWFRAIRQLLGLPFDLWALLVTWLPGPIGQRLRFRYWRARLRSLGDGSVIDIGVFIQGPEYVSIGANSWIDRHVHILAGPARPGRSTLRKPNENFSGEEGEVLIGSYTHIAPFCVLSGIAGIQIGDYSGVASGAKIYSFSHHYRNLADPDDPAQYSFTPLARPDQQAMIAGPVVLGDHSAVGLGCILLPGVTIGRGAWLASGDVAGKDVPDQTLAFAKTELVQKKLDDLEIVV